MSRLYGLVIPDHPCGLLKDLYAVSKCKSSLYVKFAELCSENSSCDCRLIMGLISFDVSTDLSSADLASTIRDKFGYELELKPVELDVLYAEGLSNHNMPYIKRCLECEQMVYRLDSPCESCDLRPGEWNAWKVHFWRNDETKYLELPKEIILQRRAMNCLPYYIPLEKGKRIYIDSF